jgi:hypothetical protein
VANPERLPAMAPSAMIASTRARDGLETAHVRRWAWSPFPADRHRRSAWRASSSRPARPRPSTSRWPQAGQAPAPPGPRGSPCPGPGPGPPDLPLEDAARERDGAEHVPDMDRRGCPIPDDADGRNRRRSAAEYLHVSARSLRRCQPAGPLAEQGGECTSAWRRPSIGDGRVKGSDRITVDLGGSHESVEVHDPATGSSPIRKLTVAGAVPLTWGDHPVVIDRLGRS